MVLTIRAAEWIAVAHPSALLYDLIQEPVSSEEFYFISKDIYCSYDKDRPSG